MVASGNGCPFGCLRDSGQLRFACTIALPAVPFSVFRRRNSLSLLGAEDLDIRRFAFSAGVGGCDLGSSGPLCAALSMRA